MDLVTVALLLIGGVVLSGNGNALMEFGGNILNSIGKGFSGEPEKGSDDVGGSEDVGDKEEILPDNIAEWTHEDYKANVKQVIEQTEENLQGQFEGVSSKTEDRRDFEEMARSVVTKGGFRIVTENGVQSPETTFDMLCKTAQDKWDLDRTSDGKLDPKYGPDGVSKCMEDVIQEYSSKQAVTISEDGVQRADTILQALQDGELGNLKGKDMADAIAERLIPDTGEDNSELRGKLAKEINKGLKDAERLAGPYGGVNESKIDQRVYCIENRIEQAEIYPQLQSIELQQNNSMNDVGDTKDGDKNTTEPAETVAQDQKAEMPAQIVTQETSLDR